MVHYVSSLLRVQTNDGFFYHCSLCLYRSILQLRIIDKKNMHVQCSAKFSRITILFTSSHYYYALSIILQKYITHCRFEIESRLERNDGVTLFQ